MVAGVLKTTATFLHRIYIPGKQKINELEVAKISKHKHFFVYVFILFYFLPFWLIKINNWNVASKNLATLTVILISVI